MKIEVTQEDIDEGVAGDCEACPIAQAGFRATLSHTQVMGKRIRLYGVWRDLPPEAINFVLRFDNGGLVTPFSFEVDCHEY